MMLQEFELAEESFKEVLQLEPENKTARRQRQECFRKMKEQRQKEKKLYQNMFSKPIGVDDER